MEIKAASQAAFFLRKPSSPTLTSTRAQGAWTSGGSATSASRPSSYCGRYGAKGRRAGATTRPSRCGAAARTRSRVTSMPYAPSGTAAATATTFAEGASGARSSCRRGSATSASTRATAATCCAKTRRITAASAGASRRRSRTIGPRRTGEYLRGALSKSL